MSDSDQFRTRATEIFRQLRRQAGAEEGGAKGAEQQGIVSEHGPEEVTLGEDETVPPEEVQDPSDVAAPDFSSSSSSSSFTGTSASGSDPLSYPEAETPPAAGMPPTAEEQPPVASPGAAETALLASVTATTEAVHDEGERPNPLEGVAFLEDEPTDTPDQHPGASRGFPRVIAIANQKGGVGKTTTAVNLGAALAELGFRVLVTDLDPQGNATTGLGINGRNLDTSIYDVLLHDVPIEDVIEPSTLRNLFVVPATIDLAGAEIELVPTFSRELRLRRALDTVREDFEFVLIDCPPSLGLLTVNGLAAATEVLVPIQCEYYALEGLGQLLRNVNLVQGNLNSTLELSTIVLTMYDARTRLAEQVINDVRSHFGRRVCRNVVPRTVRLSEAPSFGQPIIMFDPSSRGAIAYRELAKEVSGWHAAAD